MLPQFWDTQMTNFELREHSRIELEADGFMQEDTLHKIKNKLL